MKSYIINESKEIENIIHQCNKFADRIQSDKIFHRLQMPLLWFKHFTSIDDLDSGKKRGRNLLGYKFWVKKLSFIIVEDKKNIIGIAPLYINDVIINRGEDIYKILSFCPDSVLIFYQDLLVCPNSRAAIISMIFNIIEDLIVENDLILFLGHIPEDSSNIPYIRDEINKRVKNGWVSGEATNRSRGGIYPWNLQKLVKYLENIYDNCVNDNELRKSIFELKTELKKQSNSLLMFPATRKILEKELNNILMNLRNKKRQNDILDKIKELIISKPIEYPYLRLAPDIQEFMNNLSSSKRYYYRRYMKKFIESGGNFEIIEDNNITKKDLEDYLDLHKQRWKTDSAAVNQNTIPFHIEASRTMAKSGYFKLIFANHNGRRIAAISCFDVGKRREFYYAGRTETDNNLRAGKIIVYYAILDAIKNGIRIFDFGYGAEEYKYDFTHEYRCLKSFFLTKEKSLPELNHLFPLYEYIKLSDI